MCETRCALPTVGAMTSFVVSLDTRLAREQRESLDATRLLAREQCVSLDPDAVSYVDALLLT